MCISYFFQRVQLAPSSLDFTAEAIETVTQMYCILMPTPFTQLRINSLKIDKIHTAHTQTICTLYDLLRNLTSAEQVFRRRKFQEVAEKVQCRLLGQTRSCCSFGRFWSELRETSLSNFSTVHVNCNAIYSKLFVQVAFRNK